MIFRAFIFITFLFFTPELNASTNVGVCTTRSCLHTASRINHYINTDADPCENFYEFACGGFLKDAHGDEDLLLDTQLTKYSKLEKIELFREKIKDDDHKLVKLAKTLFNGCLNEPQIEEDAVKTLRKVFEQVGGWPVLEGSKWNEENFNWVNTTYKLRDLGYHSGIFADLKTSYVAEEHHHLLEVTYGDFSEENLEAMVEMVMKFDPENREDVIKELKSVYELAKEIHKMWVDKPFVSEVLTVEQLQEKVPLVNWLEYINHIAGPVVQVTKDDKVYFLTTYLEPLMELIAKTPKRTLANLMMWEVMRNVMPYFQDISVNPYVVRYLCKNRAEFCAESIDEKFYPSPIEVMYNRKYLPVEKKKEIEELAASMKTIAIEMIKNANWLGEEKKNEMVEKMRSLKIQIGLPGDYFDDKIFNYAEVDLVEVENGTFFDLLARMKRNLKASEYRLVKKSEDSLEMLYYSLSNNEGYQSTENLIYIPAYMTRDLVYNVNVPKNVNYGIMGMIIGEYITQVMCVGCLEDFSEKAKELLGKKRECVQNSWKDVEIDEWDENTVLASSIAQQLAYEAYQLHVRANGGKHPMYVGVTPDQLFWVSTAIKYCQPLGPIDYWFVEYEKNADKTSVYKINNPTSWNHKFSEDFKCQEKAKMNPEEKCKIF